MSETMPAAVTEIFAYMARDPNGNEGVANIQTQGAAGELIWVPLIAYSREQVEQFKATAVAISKQVGAPLSLVRFSNREDLGTVGG